MLCLSLNICIFRPTETTTPPVATKATTLSIATNTAVTTPVVTTVATTAPVVTPPFVTIVARECTCAVNKKFQSSCCFRGGSWFKKCGDPGDSRFEHTWSQGLQACKSKFIRMIWMNF